MIVRAVRQNEVARPKVKTVKNKLTNQKTKGKLQ